MFLFSFVAAPVVKSAVDSGNITVLLSDTLIIEFTILRAIPAVSKSGVEWRFTGANGLFNCVSRDCEFSDDQLVISLISLITLFLVNAYIYILYIYVFFICT